MKRSHHRGLALPLLTILAILLLVACSGRPQSSEKSLATDGAIALSPAPTLPPTRLPPAEQSVTETDPPSRSIDPTAIAPSPPPEPTRTIAPTAVATPEPTATPPQAIAHTVQAGESLLKLAQTYQVPIAAIQLENQLGERISIRAGQLLTIPAACEWDDASPYWLLHLVQAGETLSGIAAAHGLKVAAIQQANDLSNADTLAIGQAVILPFSGPEGILALAPPPPASAPRTDQSGAAAAPLPPAAPAGPVAGWPGEVYQQINAIRAAHGLYPLTYSTQLATAAQHHAQDCANRGWCSHTGSDGSSALTRILRAGFPAVGTSECWVQARNPQQAVAWWMNEVPPNDPHRRTLLSTHLTHIGVGVVATGNGYYFVADFGRAG
jgi:uncharacterized protein YkwD